MAIAKLNAPELTKGALSIAFVKNPNDPLWAKDPAARALPQDHAHAPPGREAERRLPLVRHDRRLDDGRHAEAGRPEPDPLVAAAGGADRSTPTGTRSCSRGSACGRRRSDYYPLEGVYLYRYDNAQWVKGSTLLPAR